MKRREFITLLGGAAVMWPPDVRAQQPDQKRRVGVLVILSETDPQTLVRTTAFQQGLEKLGWKVGRNVQIDYRFGVREDERARAAATDLLRLTPDVMVVSSGAALRAVQQATRTTPIVFVGVSEPAGVANLAHPGGNTTGFTTFEPSMGAKWLELLKEIAPHVTRVAIMFNPGATPVAPLFVPSAQEAAPRFGMETVTTPVHASGEIEAVMARLGGEPGSGLIIPPDSFLPFHYKLIVEQAARYRLPAIYAFRFYADAGGLVSYGPDIVDEFRQAAAYVDRILRGEKAIDLPVQQPTKFEFVINLKTAKALGLEVPPILLARADEVIE
ncbi:putative ABC transport system substrate-binding protein [Bradyrhizobium lablabi]|uniref:Putative ABC transport system substrate-binding protein n=1 Tax=Bradyrhizobium lablabi TaxID=722472 RepID=A0A1M6WQL1_9BRAD|nr:ABC transporter substrate-binding protein [Bradyrhizobium lablabi]SHK95924.1 putative ABC transport system substrate-binding protein [Bradyrhizobium lablabi]